MIDLTFIVCFTRPFCACSSSSTLSLDNYVLMLLLCCGFCIFWHNLHTIVADFDSFLLKTFNNLLDFQEEFDGISILADTALPKCKLNQITF